MKTKINASILLLSLFCMSILTKTNAQTIYSANTADHFSGGLSSNVQNTGIYSVRYDGLNCHTNVWDGNRPGFSWSENDVVTYSNSFNGGNYVIDPDVASTSYLSDGTVISFFTYLINNNVFYEAWRNQNGTWSNFIQSTQITTGENSSNPNIDVNDTNALAIVWEQVGDIKILAGSTFGNMSQYINVIDGENLRFPDVSVGRDSAYNSYVNIVYFHDDGNNTLQKYSFSYNDLMNQENSPSEFGFTYRVYGDDYLGHPRIASPVHGIKATDCEVVVEHFIDSTNKYIIKGLHYRNNYYYGPTNISDSLIGLNTEPVVAYSNTSDSIIVCWTHNDSIGTYGNPFDIIQRKLNYTNGIPAYSYFSAVNQSLANNQVHASVCGRYLTNSHISYLFYDETKDSLLSKTSMYFNQNIRLGKVNHTYSIYPNPAESKFYIGKLLSNGMAKVKILDVNGRLIKQFENIESNEPIDVSDLEKGIYFIEIFESDNYTTERLIII